jgi:hypothetical protein
MHAKNKSEIQERFFEIPKENRRPFPLRVPEVMSGSSLLQVFYHIIT